MSNFDNLSDDQLRTKLIEYGFPPMPITSTTRNLMLKKLKLLHDNKKKQNAQDRRSLVKYSSDDDSETERKTKPRRVTVAPVVTTKPKVSKIPTAAPMQQTNGKHNKNEHTEPKKERKSRVVVEVRHLSPDTSSDTEPDLQPQTRKTARSSKEVKQGKSAYYEQDDVEDEEDNSLGMSFSSFVANSDTTSNTPDSALSADSPPKLFTTAPKIHTPSVQRPQPVLPRHTSYSSQNTYDAFVNPADGAKKTSTPVDDELRHRRNRDRHTTGTRPFSYGYLGGEQELTRDDDFQLGDTPYLQNFSKRISTLTQQNNRELDRGSSQRNQRAVERKEVCRVLSGKDIGYFTRLKQNVRKCLRFESTRRFISNSIARSFCNSQKGDENKGNFISLALVTGVTAFFIILLALYYGMHLGSNTNEITGLNIPFCTSSITKDCLTEDEARGGIDLYKIFKPKLIELAINHHCGPTSTGQQKTYMTDADIVKFIKENYKIQDTAAIREDIDSFVLIAHHNQFTGVSVLKVDEGSDEYLICDDVKQSNQELEDGRYSRAFAVLSPTLPWRCYFWKKVTALFNVVTVILIVAGALHIGHFIYRKLKYNKYKKKEKVMMLVEKVLEIMQTQSSEDQYLVINHVRDMIIPIDARQKLDTPWQKAVAFINTNESRIRTEIQDVRGESYEVWRWIGGQNVSLNCSTTSPSKCWQGQAFELQNLPCSPTPCLKIRGMIDDAEVNCNSASIREAILSKCAQSRVLHIAVDVNTKCVYLKCADTNDAGIAYRSLHGNWFAGHLVTVKYLRLERYMQRFPDSPQSGPPFLKC